MINVHGGDIYKHKDVIDFSANINPLGLPRGVKIALMDSIDLAVHYPDVRCEELCKSLAKYYGIKKNYILCSNGAADIIFAITAALKPKKALILAPGFAEYEQALHAIDAKIFCYRLKEEQGFILKEDFLNAVTKEIDMVFLCNPNNPTGEVIPKELMMRIIETCKKNKTILVIDECFISFLENGAEVSVIKEVERYDNLIVINAFTKLYAMPGIRLGFAAIGNIKMIELINKVRQPWSVSVLAQKAGVAALEQKEYVAKTKELIRDERSYLMHELLECGFQIYGSKANYIFFKGQKGLFDLCIKEGILIRDCSNYRGLEEGFYRVAIKGHEENKKLIEVLKRCQNGRNKE
ncbi:threonine-phosphate decarboxylase CobD [Candidatus Galacturonibacter soehngenii]|nr:threonine-phosphate decarboxylase CobD [Candidatus Galacturonibacter soehngenii]